MSLNKLPKKIFECVVKHTPLISIDIILEVKKDFFLLGKRKNPPAKGFFFVPGGRILKDEKIEEAFKRILEEELNLEYSFKQAKFLGFFEHLYIDNFLGNKNFGTHYIVLAFHIKAPINLKNLPLEQHEVYQVFNKYQILTTELVHPYTKEYFKSL